jgi:thymidylate synthase
VFFPVGGTLGLIIAAAFVVVSAAGLLWKLNTVVQVYSEEQHIEAAKEQIRRKPKPLPKLKIIGDIKTIDDFREENFELIGYDPHPHIKTDLVIV